MSISVATFRVNLRWRRAKYSVFTTAKLSVFTLAYRSSPSWQMTSSDHCWGLEKKVHLGEILVSIRSMSEHCKQVVIPSPQQPRKVVLCCFTTLLIWRLNLYSSAKCVFNKSSSSARWWHCQPQQHLSLTWARNLKLETLFANATGTEKLTCKLGTLFAQTHFYGKNETLAYIWWQIHQSFVASTQSYIFYANLLKRSRNQGMFVVTKKNWETDSIVVSFV